MVNVRGDEDAARGRLANELVGGQECAHGPVVGEGVVILEPVVGQFATWCCQGSVVRHVLQLRKLGARRGVGGDDADRGFLQEKSLAHEQRDDDADETGELAEVEEQCLRE